MAYVAPTEQDRTDRSYLRQVFTTKRDLAVTRAKHLKGEAKTEHEAKAGYWQGKIDALTGAPNG
jgi:hypothetical protein